MTNKKLLLVIDTDWFFLSHRLPVALGAKKNGWSVVIVAADTGKADVIRGHGLGFIHANLVRNKLNPFHELRIIKELYTIYKEERPDIVHHVTLKIILNGGIAAKLAGVTGVVNAVAGLGHFFINPKKAWLVNILFSPVFRLIKTIRNLNYIFQNEDDRGVFLKRGWTKPVQAKMIKGSGVDLEQFAYTPEPDSGPVKILCGTRLLKDKGIIEFIGAAALLKSKHGAEVEFILAGKIITENPTSISENEIMEWVSQGLITFIGFQENMYTCLAGSHINVLPSYREGLPKSLIEASAVGRPMVTTDVPGCRDIVTDGVNGYLVPVKNVEKLAEAINALVTDKTLRTKMGIAARKKAFEEFSIDKVVSETLKVYAGMIE